MALMSQREFAKHIGRSHVYVNKLVKQGKIPTVDGKIDSVAGAAAVEASQQLGFDTNRANAEKQRQKSASTAKPKAAASKPKTTNSQKQDQQFDMPDDDEMLPSSGQVSVNKVADMFNRARLAEKTFSAKLKEIDYKEKQGLFLSKDAVDADAAAVAEELRGLLFAIAPRISPLCEGKTAREIEVIIESAINDSLTALQKSRFGK